MKTTATLTVLLLGLAVSSVHAADQTILGNKFSVKNPSVDVTKRKVKGSGKEGPGSPNTIGPTNNPVANGASLEVIANAGLGGTPSDQTFDLPKEGWSATPLGYKYSNKAVVIPNRAVKKASIKITPSQVFIIKISIRGSDGLVNVVPPNPGSDGGFILSITGGDRYCVGFGGAFGGFVKKNDSKAWQIQRPTFEGCPVAGVPATTTTVTVSTSTSTTGVTTTSTTATTTTNTTIPGCDCCASSVMGALLSFTTSPPGGPVTGSVTPARCTQGTNNGTACTSDANCTGGGLCRGHLDGGGLYFGGGQPAGINLPASIPDLGLSYSKVEPCVAGVPQLAPTTDADVPGPGCAESGTPSYGMRHCTSPGCRFGPPLAIPNFASPATSTCVVNSIANEPGAGTGTVICGGGATTLNLPLTSEVFLTGPLLGAQACPTCTGGTPGVCSSGTCNGGSRDGQLCTPETSALPGRCSTTVQACNVDPDCPGTETCITSYPTSSDCPPTGSIGSLPVPFTLSTGTQTKNSFNTSAMMRVFCGYCFDPDVTVSFENPPHECDADSDCTNGFFTSCQQHSAGAFRNPFATSISETGAAPNACLLDEMPHASTLVSVFCVPPAYHPIVDPNGELPGPGAASLPGFAQMIVP